MSAICSDCIQDVHLKEIATKEGEPLICSVCMDDKRDCLGVEQLASLLEPVMRSHFSIGKEVQRLDTDDKLVWDQEGDDLSWVVQEVLGQYVEFERELIHAIIKLDDYRPQDGEDPFWEDTANYVPTNAYDQFRAKWDGALEELKSRQRFFSQSAKELFSDLFNEVDTLVISDNGVIVPVVRSLETGTVLHRSRLCRSNEWLKDFYRDPFTQVGPPPQISARAGRMNADGIVVFYGAIEQETCLAELRPPLGGFVVAISVRTAKPLRILDFIRLDKARDYTALSYFQPTFDAELAKRRFLRRLHTLVSRQITPGHETDYLITQTMAEYLTHLAEPPFNGVIFSSPQAKGGQNIVLFADPGVLSDSTSQIFGIDYVPESFRLFRTKRIEYEHDQVQVLVTQDNEVFPQVGDDDTEIGDE